MIREHIMSEGIETTNSGTAYVIRYAGLSSGRNLRDLLVRATLSLGEARAPDEALIYLVRPKLSVPFVVEQSERYREMLRQDLAGRLVVEVEGLGVLPGAAEGVAFPIREERIPVTATSVRMGLPLPQADKRSEVFRVLLRQWINGYGPVTSTWLEEEAVGCDYRTVAATIDELQPVVHRHSDRSIELKYFPDDAWRRFVALAPKARTTLRYTDRSGQPRSAESLVARFARLERQDIAVGGVLGAKRYYPSLDLVGTPQLDLTIHAPGPTADLEFIRKLDPALEATKDGREPARLVIHFLRRKCSFFDLDEGLRWADPIECLVDLFEMRLLSQARAFQDFLEGRARELSGAD